MRKILGPVVWFGDEIARRIVYLAGFIVLVSGAMSWVASYVAPIAQYGWGAVVFAGIGVACIIMLVASGSAVAWRYFNPLPNQPSTYIEPGYHSRFRPSASEQIGQPLSHQELDYHTQQRRFIFSNLNEMLTKYLFVTSFLGNKWRVEDGSASQMYWFVEYALDRGIRRRYGELQKAAQSDFAGTSTGIINGDILQFLKEYEIVSAFPGKIEKLAGLGKTSRDDWDAAHQRCKSALRDLRASSFAGILAESAAMETLQVMPRDQ